MWRLQPPRQGREVLTKAGRLFASDASGQAKPPPPPPPAAPKRGGGGFLKFLGISTFLGVPAGVIGYAWYDPEFRKKMELDVPFAKEALQYILPEPIKPVENLKPVTAPIAPALDNMSQAIASPPIDIPKETVELPPSDISTEREVKKEVSPEVKSKPSKQDVQAELRKKAEEDKADNAALEVVIHRLLTNSQKVAEEAVKAQMDVASATRNHTKLLQLAMDDTADILHKDAQWEAVTVAFKEMETAVTNCNELVADTKNSIQKLRDVLAESRSSPVTKNNPAINPATKRVAELTKELNKATTQVRQAEAEAKVMSKYKDLVEKGKKQFQQELESLFPDVKVGSSGRKLSDEELNALIAHAHRRIEQLQKQLAEQMALEQQRLNSALDMQKAEDKEMSKEMVKEETVRLLQEFEIEKQKLEMDLLVEQEAEVRRQLARQAGAHSDHLRDVLAVQAQQMSQEFNLNLNSKILEERENFQSEVASWIGRLHGLEAAIDARAASEELARGAQDLWLACISLNSSIHFGSEEEAIKPLQDELKAILRAANKHPFVETVAQTIPKEALERGVYTEESLRNRFTKVATVCRRLGLLTEENRSLYKYFISYLHSYFVWSHVKAINENDMVDLEKVDNHDLLAYAQYWMDHGNLEMALRFMNQLKGESYVAASDWIKEARLLLETRQAASTLTAYASATGLANTF